MSKLNLVGAVAAGVLAIATFATASPAAADAQFGVYVGPTYSAPAYGPSGCRHWSERLQDWVWSCRRHAYHAYPSYGPYAYSYGPSIGFSFGIGGDNHHHRHHHNNY